jgi:hypothetical protein
MKSYLVMTFLHCKASSFEGCNIAALAMGLHVVLFLVFSKLQKFKVKHFVYSLCLMGVYSPVKAQKVAFAFEYGPPDMSPVMPRTSHQSCTKRWWFHASVQFLIVLAKDMNVEPKVGHYTADNKHLNVH